jgi:thioredoxin-like negative regulator of GroEL
MPEDDAHADAAEALRTLARLAIAAPGLEAGGPAERAVAAAGAAIRTADWETAFAALVRALEHDRGAVHGAAREGARVMVRLLGTGHPAIDRHWRAFTAVMGR